MVAELQGETLRPMRLQLAGAILNMAGGVLGSGTIQRKFKASEMVQRWV